MALDSQPTTLLKGVGPRMEAKLAKLGIHSVRDLLFHLPARYQDRTRITPIGTLRPGDNVMVEGDVQHTEIKMGRRRMLLSRISDGSGLLTLRFFYFNSGQQNRLSQGQRVRCFGEIRGGGATLEIIHPEIKLINSNRLTETLDDALTPIYPATEGLQQPTLRKLVTQALVLLENSAESLSELLPAETRSAHHYPTTAEAIQFIHYPPPEVSQAELEAGTHPAQQRLAFEELLAHQLSLRELHRHVRQQGGPPLNGNGALRKTFTQRLPYQLTGAQQRVIGEINQDLSQPYPMQRLVQGDVGSGKTVVAAMAALSAIEAGHQAVLMAPTELLAEQHYRNFSEWLTPLDLQVTLLAGKLKGKQRQGVLSDLESGEAQMIVGTHALFQQGVEFARLGLVIIDEQHRFGVHQRLALKEKGAADNRVPHQLIMTATPIPRTLAMSVFADLDCSTIDELPPGRSPVETVVVPNSRRPEVIQRIYSACQSGRQVYWVCTLIEESEVLQCQAAEDAEIELRNLLSGVRIGLVHGRMKPSEKKQVMDAFKRAEIDLLVATTVIEVGVDVPNASLMVIENAERLGLAQLHQLRGRVGRGTTRSSCLLMYHSPLSRLAKSRLSIMRETNDGFLIARRDLEIRGPGDVLGTRQTGDITLQIADLLRDEQLLPQVEAASELIQRRYPQLIQPLIQRWIGKGLKFAEV
ncbi:MAG: ATP-dependent DNA helicase RecG [Gammaproteobacteria bacterium]|nr:ATP-dependent DNA helicase RecG [Gammaproteobacteria bacterium]MCF6230368.1 ATP-dependent DNA helicase RecG [Gammaproteobacteria bacterium]